jgi:hypothetical protein
MAFRDARRINPLKYKIAESRRLAARSRAIGSKSGPSYLKASEKTESSTPSSRDSTWNGKPAPSTYLHKQLDVALRGSDGEEPSYTPLLLGGKLYGTTAAGGGTKNGGIAYEVTP